MPEPRYEFNISLNVLNHLGRGLYRNFITILGEAISNSWDADAKNIWINIDEEAGLVVKDDGVGMSEDDFRYKFLRVGYTKRRRKNGKLQHTSPGGRYYIGRKGIGKLALLSCADEIAIYSKKEAHELTGGIINNEDLDEFIEKDMDNPDKEHRYPLEALKPELKRKYDNELNTGTILVFEGLKTKVARNIAQVRKLIALSFKFTLVDPDFIIHVNGEPIDPKDLQELIENTEFMWQKEGDSLQDPYIAALEHVKNRSIAVSNPKIEFNFFVASVKMPRNLSIHGLGEKIGIDFFSNGRLREKNILEKMPSGISARVPANYLYGQLHCNIFDRSETDPYNTARDGMQHEIEENDESILFRDLLKEFELVLKQILAQWDELRIRNREEGDPDGDADTKMGRAAASMLNTAFDDFSSENPKQSQLLSDILRRGKGNMSMYTEQFMIENLIRYHIEKRMDTKRQAEVDEQGKCYKKRESEGKKKAGLPDVVIREPMQGLEFLDAKDLAKHLEEIAGNAAGDKGRPSDLEKLIKRQSLIRNAMAHTAILTDGAVDLGKAYIQFIKERIKKLENQPGADDATDE